MQEPNSDPQRECEIKASGLLLNFNRISFCNRAVRKCAGQMPALQASAVRGAGSALEVSGTSAR